MQSFARRIQSPRHIHFPFPFLFYPSSLLSLPYQLLLPSLFVCFSVMLFVVLLVLSPAVESVMVFNARHDALWQSALLSQFEVPVKPSPESMFDSLGVLWFYPPLIRIWIAPVPSNIQGVCPNLQHLSKPNLFGLPSPRKASNEPFSIVFSRLATSG